ncbi:MAG: acyl transferase [Saprospiraceae bacterium]|nr:acyl transferase [Saprospiraceae bacterium]
MNLKTEIINYLSGESVKTFDEIAFMIYEVQSEENPHYRSFLEVLGQDKLSPSSIEDIPLLPISAFKHHKIKTGSWDAQSVFLSSGTSHMDRSRHYVGDLNFYKHHTLHTFKGFYKNALNKILSLLPSYIENGDSSLVHMVDNMMDYYNDKEKAHFLYDFEALKSTLDDQETNGHSTVLIGVTFALLDFAKEFKSLDSNLTIIFTGGMKNRGIELSYEEVFDTLKKSFPNSTIDSEFGMTEMFSQSYCQNSKDGFYTPASSLYIQPKELNDPLTTAKIGKTGQLGFIDLANYQTCSFVLTDDLCIKKNDGRFKVLGRMAQSDIRGCNMLYQI